MIFVTVGTHESQFNRLIQKVDELKESGKITEEVVIQTGYSDYEPAHCTFQKFYPFDEMDRLVSEARIVITHGGPSSFFAALQKGKTPIVVPRIKEFGEHVNDHQLVFAGQVEERYHNILVVRDISELEGMIANYDSLEAAIPKTEGSQNAEFCRRFKDIAAFLEPSWNLRNLPDDIQHVFVVGTGGFGHGGYESLLDKMASSQREGNKILYHFSCILDDDRTKMQKELPNIEFLSDTEYLYENAHCFMIKMPKRGLYRESVYDKRALKYCVRYIKKHHIEQPIIYVLSSRVGSAMKGYANQIHRLGGKYFHNLGGGPRLLSEQSMVKSSDMEICNCMWTEEFINKKYSKYSPATTIIEYDPDKELHGMLGDESWNMILNKYQDLFLA